MRIEQKKNFVFLGEAGSGKSEIAVNVACMLGKKVPHGRKVHFFDLDQTKPLFRSRDVRGQLEKEQVTVHFDRQFLDAPTLVGGVAEHLRDERHVVILDVGGNHIGARMIGRFSELLNQENTVACFVINPYRPWSKDLRSIDQTLSSILQVSHIEKVEIISNPNLGADTSEEEVLAGHRRVMDLISEKMPVSCLCVRRELYEKVRRKIGVSVMPMDLRMQYGDI